MDPNDTIVQESGERLAISMAVSALLAELPEDGRVAALHQVLTDIIEGHLAELTDDGTAGNEATREMFAHATAALDRIFVMAKRQRSERWGLGRGE